MTEKYFKALEQQLDHLLARCAQMEQDNLNLRAKESSWEKERLKLMEKNEVARTRVESMIDRLRALEQEHLSS